MHQWYFKSYFDTDCKWFLMFCQFLIHKENENKSMKVYSVSSVENHNIKFFFSASKFLNNYNTTILRHITYITLLSYISVDWTIFLEKGQNEILPALIKGSLSLCILKFTSVKAIIKKRYFGAFNNKTSKYCGVFLINTCLYCIMQN